MKESESISNSEAEAIVRKYTPKLLGAARRRLSQILRSRVDPEDIVQSTFKSFFRRARGSGYLAPESEDLFNLLIVIAMRKISNKVDYHFAQNRDARTTTTSYSTGEHEEASSDDGGLLELCLVIDEITNEYSLHQKQIVTLRLEGFSVEEIAIQVDRSKRTVERELHQFRKRLASEFAP